MACARASGSIPHLQNRRRGLETGRPDPSMCSLLHPDPLHPRQEKPEFLLPCLGSLSPPGVRSASNRSGKSSISLGGRASDSKSWCLISEPSKPFSQCFIVTSSLFQLTNLCLIHIVHQRKLSLPQPRPCPSASHFHSSP